VDISGIGNFLKNSRKSKHLTQGFVADQLGISAQAISKWERGENLPDIAFFPDIARIYEVDIEEILGAGKKNSFEEAIKKVQSQLDLVIDGLSVVDSYETVLDEILPYTNASQRLEILRLILKRRDYETLQALIPYMNNNMKTEVLLGLLAELAYDAIEDIMPIFTRKHRDLLVAHFIKQRTDVEIVENFIPFFDRKQKEDLS